MTTGPNDPQYVEPDPRSAIELVLKRLAHDGPADFADPLVGGLVELVRLIATNTCHLSTEQLRGALQFFLGALDIGDLEAGADGQLSAEHCRRCGYGIDPAIGVGVHPICVDPTHVEVDQVLADAVRCQDCRTSEVIVVPNVDVDGVPGVYVTTSHDPTCPSFVLRRADL